MTDTTETFYQRRMAGWQKLLLLAVVVFSVGMVWWLFVKRSPKGETMPEARHGTAEYAPAAAWHDPAPKATPAVAAAAPAPDPTVVGKIAASLGNQSDPAADARNSSIFGQQANNGAQAHPAGADDASKVRGAEVADNTALGQALKPTKLQGSRATRLRHPELIITQGSKIPCIVPEAFTTDVPGLVTCQVPIDIRGFGGHVVLLPAGTKVVGQSQSGMRQGQARAFIVWTRAYTPEGVVVDLDSPAADMLGRSGLEGDINTHFWERFQGALLLSFIDAGLQAAALAASNGSGNNYFNSFQSNTQSVANTALQNQINIPPTLERDQGLPAMVFVARDLDFSDIYNLEFRR